MTKNYTLVYGNIVTQFETMEDAICLGNAVVPSVYPSYDVLGIDGKRIARASYPPVYLTVPELKRLWRKGAVIGSCCEIELNGIFQGYPAGNVDSMANDHRWVEGFGFFPCLAADACKKAVL